VPEKSQHPVAHFFHPPPPPYSKGNNKVIRNGTHLIKSQAEGIDPEEQLQDDLRHGLDMPKEKQDSSRLGQGPGASVVEPQLFITVPGPVPGPYLDYERRMKFDLEFFF
jgi:hypothetical protein